MGCEAYDVGADGGSTGLLIFFFKVLQLLSTTVTGGLYVLLLDFFGVTH